MSGREVRVPDPDGCEELAAGPAPPRIAVVIVTHNSASVLRGCLDSLAAGLRDVSLTEVVVADNASTDSGVAIATAYGRIAVRLVHLGRNAGYAAGINAAVASLDDCDAVLILNPDVRLRPGAAAALAAALNQPNVGIAVPRLSTPEGALLFSLRREPTLSRALAQALIGGDRAARIGCLGERVTSPQHYARPGYAVWATGAAMLVSRETLRAIGPWDESYLLYSEETDFALRGADGGRRVWFEPTAEAEHLGGESGTNPMLSALLAVNRTRLYRQRRGRVAGAMYLAAVTVGEALRAAAGRPTSRAALAALIYPSRRLRELPGADPWARTLARTDQERGGTAV